MGGEGFGCPMCGPISHMAWVLPAGYGMGKINSRNTLHAVWALDLDIQALSLVPSWETLSGICVSARALDG